MVSPRLRGLVIALTLVAVATACASRTEPTDRHPEPQAQPSVTKVLVFVIENHSLQQMRSGMPWLARRAKRYGYATGYRALTHPSLPNYLAIASGHTFGVTDDRPPAAHPIRRPSIFGRALAAGSTATTYAEDMTSPCQRTDRGRYAARHNPWTYFRTERSECREHDVPLTQLTADVASGDLPRVGMVVPDLCHDAHDCALSRADAWLRRYVGKALAGPDFASGELAIVVTADEDDRRHGNRVLTVVLHPLLHHRVVRRALDHYSLLRSCAEAVGIAPPGRAADATSLLGAFGLG